MKREDTTEARGKEPYAKPVLRTIDLKAEEVLASGCKTVAVSAPAGASCAANFCSAFGS